MEDCERAVESGSIESDGSERPLLHFLSNRCLWRDRDAGIDFHCPLDGLDIVELHYGLGFNVVFAEYLVDCFPGRDIRIEADKLVVSQRFDIYPCLVGERVLRVTNRYKAILSERDHFDLARFLGKGNESKVHGVVKNVLVDKIGATIFDSDIHRRVVGEKRLNERW